LTKTFDISAYLVIGPENTKERPVSQIIALAVKAGFTCVQIRSKIASARDLIELVRETADVIAQSEYPDRVTLLLNDRLDVILAAREQGLKLDGIHIGQSDIPATVCRKYLGDDAVIGLSAKTIDLIEYVRNADTRQIDYFGAGPLHETATKKDCEVREDGKPATTSIDDISELVKLSTIPVVVGGGVKLADIPLLARTGIAGFFVVSAVSESDNPYQSACDLVEEWKKYKA